MITYRRLNIWYDVDKMNESNKPANIEIEKTRVDKKTANGRQNRMVIIKVKTKLK